MIQPHNELEAAGRILIVDDEAPVRRMILRTLGQFGQIFEAGDGIQARALLETQSMDVVITDLAMPGMDGLALMQWAHEYCPDPTWIILSGRLHFDDAVQAVHLGAYEFIPKPIQSLETLAVAVRNALRHREMTRQQRLMQEEIQQANERLHEQVNSLSQACQLLCRQAETLEEDFRRAELIQRALLPCAVPALGNYAVHSLYRPSHNVGGDLYDVVRLDDRHLAVYVADAAGHGVSSAMLTVLFKHRIPLTTDQPPRPTPPAEVLRAVNLHILQECSRPGLFVTAAYCLIDTENGQVQIASAGHPPVLVHHANGELECVRATGPALGLSPDARFEQRELTLNQKDRLLLYTDGLYGADTRQHLDAQARIAEALTASNLNGQALLQAIWVRAAQSTNPSRDDDVTLVLLTARPELSSLDNGEFDETRGEIQAAPAPMPARILVGQEDGRTVLAIRGRATWMHAANFHDACIDALNAGQHLTIDLAGCEYLDSTLLGTLQEIVVHSTRNGTVVSLQSAGLEIRGLLAELGLDQVIERIAEVDQPLPEKMTPLEAAPADQQRNRKRMLQAHEALARLSDVNSQEFARLIECLKSEMAQGS